MSILFNNQITKDSFLICSNICKEQEVTQQYFNQLKKEQKIKSDLLCWQKATVLTLIDTHISSATKKVYLTHHESGMPILSDKSFISISHADEKCIIYHHLNTKVGVDIQKMKASILNLGHKFMNEDELSFLEEVEPEKRVAFATFIWTIKEAVFKYHSEHGIAFKSDVFVKDFNKNDFSEANVLLKTPHKTEIILLKSKQIDDFILTYTM